LQCVVVCCLAVTKCCRTRCMWLVLCVAACCSVLQCVAVRCSVLQCAAVCCSVLHCVAVCCSVLQYVAVCCSVLQCVAVCVAVCCSVCVRCLLSAFQIVFTRLFLRYSTWNWLYFTHTNTRCEKDRPSSTNLRLKKRHVHVKRDPSQRRVHIVCPLCAHLWYGVATISRLPKITVLFCKRAL